MKYTLEKVNKSDRSQIYSIKRNSIKPYVEKIWGWEEVYQINDFDKSFIPDNIKKIMIDTECIGFIEVSEDANTVNIAEIHIIPDYQGLGVGGSIINNVIADTKAKYKKTTLGCFKENKKAIQFYKSRGFTMVGETKTHYLFEIS